MAGWPTDYNLIGSIVARLRQLFRTIFFLSCHHLILSPEMKITIKTLQQKIFQVSRAQITPRISCSPLNLD